AAGSGLVYSTYLGGSNRDEGNSIAVDPSGNVYVTGTSYSTDFPTVKALQSTFGVCPPNCRTDFITKLNVAGSELAYSHYRDGAQGNSVAVDPSGNAYVTGLTSSTDFLTTAGAFQTTLGGGEDAFITKVSASGSLVYSTYLGGNGHDEGNGIAVDSFGNAY